MRQIIYILQYVNLDDGRTFFHYLEFDNMEELTDFIQANHTGLHPWTSYEIIVVKRYE